MGQKYYNYKYSKKSRAYKMKFIIGCNLLLTDSRDNSGNKQYRKVTKIVQDSVLP